ncbi:phosphate ABC transporter permease subunit PstC [Rubrobacter aplysinae]|uniref:phosphate ABC transporter permease subunit PstC n=1 Tax=Rubrobacter aplysinae TaxID=909625 RepID=UPI000AB2862D|nr:phosphate ABC transporter permease subunit PstC [Rubrobacter aplysinae]
MSTISKISELFKNLRRGNKGDTVFQGLTLLLSLILPLAILAIFVVLWRQSEVSREMFGIGFLWDPTWSNGDQVFGALTVIYGTLVTSGIAILLAGPIGVGIAAFLVEIASPRINSVVGFIVEILAAIPSIVYGIWGFFVFAPFLRDWVVPPLQATLGWTPIFAGDFVLSTVFTASLVLSVMILPTVASISRDVLSAVPDTQREGMLALGATRWEMFKTAVLPYARSGVLGAILLGLGRAVGETIALTYVLGNAQVMFTSLFQQGSSMAQAIASLFGASTSDVLRSSLLEIGLILFLITFLINVGARLLVSGISNQPSESNV